MLVCPAAMPVITPCALTVAIELFKLLQLKFVGTAAATPWLLKKLIVKLVVLPTKTVFEAGESSNLSGTVAGGVSGAFFEHDENSSMVKAKKDNDLNIIS